MKTNIYNQPNIISDRLVTSIAACIMIFISRKAKIDIYNQLDKAFTLVLLKNSQIRYMQLVQYKCYFCIEIVAIKKIKKAKDVLDKKGFIINISITSTTFFIL